MWRGSILAVSYGEEAAEPKGEDDAAQDGPTLRRVDYYIPPLSRRRRPGIEADDLDGEGQLLLAHGWNMWARGWRLVSLDGEADVQHRAMK
jgi:hypothetical protein